MRDFMCDLETMGVGSNAAIIQIAGVCFDINTGGIGNSFDMKIDLSDAMRYGKVTGSTIAFWMSDKVTQEARDRAMEQTPNWGDPGNTLPQVLNKFNDFLKENGVEYIHGNGVAADNVWLRNAYERTGIPEKVGFRGDLCFRTLKTLASRSGWVDSIPRLGVYHDGLDDAKHQVKILMDILNYLNMSTEML